MNMQSPGAQRSFLQQARASALPLGTSAGPVWTNVREAKAKAGLEVLSSAALRPINSQATYSS